MKTIIFAFLATLMLLFPARANDAIAVVYPSMEGPYRTAFIAMLQGVQQHTGFKVYSYPVTSRTNKAELHETIKRSGARVVIALGREGLNASASAAGDSDIPVLAGGVLLSESEHIGGISMTPDPEMLFSRLRVLLPELRRVVVIYNPHQSEWLIRRAREAARTQNLELSAHVAGDMSSAARQYGQLIANADSRYDALWLPHDSTTVEEGTIVPLVLRASWANNVPVFSSNALHVKKGVLFAMAPDHAALGRSLAAAAVDMMTAETRRPQLTPLRDLQTAINLRTASHLGLKLDAAQRQSFDLVYPSLKP